MWEHRYKYKTLLYNKGNVTCEMRKKAAGRFLVKLVS